uniref:sugar phosphate isomerase/epimerase family protein n=1 Tax=Pararhizobium sp. IMCC3301 TaxID=3067904 RepID=UPI0027409BA1|nr:sugar phosphate isomerase/epimerase family protein [Pararhizobium sp. IMCC3301]
MKIALCNEVIRDWEIGRQAAFAAALGYDGLEIAPFTLNKNGPRALNEAALLRIRKTVEAEGIEVSGLHWLLVAPDGLSITDAAADIKQRTRDTIEALVTMCATLGGAYLIHGSPAQRVLPDDDEAAARARALDHFRLAADAASKAGVNYLLEPLSSAQTAYVNTLDEAAAIVGAVGNAHFSAMIDCCSAAQAETAPIPELLSRHLPTGLIRHVHFNDPNLRGPGQGKLDFLPIVQRLTELEYDGWIGVEPFDYVPDGPAAAARAIGTIRALEQAATSGRTQ